MHGTQMILKEYFKYLEIEDEKRKVPYSQFFLQYLNLRVVALSAFNPYFDGIIQPVPFRDSLYT